MKNIVKSFRDKKAKIIVQDNIITIEREDGKNVVFEAVQNDYQIKYNTESFGVGGVCNSGIPLEIDTSSTDFINGEKYIINNVKLTKNKQNKTDATLANTYSRVLLEFETKENKFADITLRADSIKVNLNGEILQEKVRRIFAGYYKRYDGGLHFYVIRVVPDLITGEDVILCRKDSFNDFSYFVLSRKEFDSKVDCGGKKIKKYYRNTRQNPISDKELENIETDGFPTTIRRTYKEDKMHHTRMSRTYEEYAKELLEWYKHDLEACILTKKMGKIVGMASVEDYPIIVEDVRFLNQCFKTTLKDFLPFFQERFMEGKSIRKYAEDHNINRGSVEYQQKRLIVAMSNLLFDRDAVEGVCRVDYSWLK